MTTAGLDPDFLTEQIATVKAQITAHNAATLAFAANGGMEEYRLDTGQTVITVKRSSLSSMTRVLNSLYNQLDMLAARLEGGAGVVRPAW